MGTLESPRLIKVFDFKLRHVADFPLEMVIRSREEVDLTGSSKYGIPTKRTHNSSET